MISNERLYFNTNVKSWEADINEAKRLIIFDFLNKVGISNNDFLIDIGCGTGTLYPFLMEIGVKRYIGIDISNKMLDSFKDKYHDAELYCLNFNSEINESYDASRVIIFNSIPHFSNLDAVFKNARRLLDSGGTFSIVHARTREGLRVHHKSIGYRPSKVPIPFDETLIDLSDKYKFEILVLEDEKYFIYHGIKR